MDEGEDEITTCQSYFMEKTIFQQTHYYLYEGKVIGRGTKQVKEILNGLNYKFPDKEDDCFYFVKTKIKLFDDLRLDNSLKRKIYLIDFPGYGTNNKFMEKEICKKIISISSFFIFVFKNSIIKEKNTKSALKQIFNLAKEQKSKLISGFINSCLFILNNDKSQDTSVNDLELAKKDIIAILDKENKIINEYNINVSFFNAKYFCDYCNEYDYFWNIQKTFKNEHQNYLDNKKNIFKWPELIGKKNYKSFLDFLYNQLINKLKDKFGAKPSTIKTYKINKNVEIELDKILTYFSKNKYIAMEDIFKDGNKFVKIFSYAQDKVKEMNTLNESNIGNLQKLLKVCFNNSYNNIREDLIKIIGKILKTLDEFFKNDIFSNNLKIKEIQEFQKKTIKIKTDLSEIFKISEEKFNNAFQKNKNKIEDFCEDKRDNIKQNLKNNNLYKILEEINKEIEDRNKILFDEIKNIINDLNISINNIVSMGNNDFEIFSEGKIKIKFNCNFDEYLLIEIGDKNNENLFGQLFKEIKNSYNLSKIYESKGLIKTIQSFVSDYCYLKNIIEIVFKEYNQNLNYILSLLISNLMKYIQKILNIINKANELVSITFTKEQEIVWKEIGEFYQSIKPQITQTKKQLEENKF